MPRYLRWLLASVLPSYFIKEPRFKSNKNSGPKLEFSAFVDKYNPPSLWHWRVTLHPKYDCNKFVVINRLEFYRLCQKNEMTMCGRQGFRCEFREK